MQINWVSWCTVHTDTLTFQPVTLVQQHVPSADTHPERREAGSRSEDRYNKIINSRWQCRSKNNVGNQYSDELRFPVSVHLYLIIGN